MGIAVVALVACLGAVARAQGESLTLSLPTSAAVNKFYAITAEGTADGSHRLFVYVEPGGAACAASPDEEATKFSDSIAVFGHEGVALAAGPFASTTSVFAPAEESLYSVCGYLDAMPAGVADAAVERRFAVPSGPVEAPELSQVAKEELKRLAEERERELEEERTATRERAEREEREAAALRHNGTLDPPPAEPAPVHASVAAPATARCVVPGLRGHSLVWARRALGRAGCSLGKVRRPHAGQRALVVIRQDIRRGTSLRDGASVGVVLGLPPR